MKKSPAPRARPNPALRRWLRSGAAAADGDPQDEGFAAGGWDAWVLERMNQGALLRHGDVFVDRAVLEARFACVPERCAPRRGRGGARSCCADCEVVLDAGERRRLASHERRLGQHLSPREPRLETGASGWPFARGESGSCLARPAGRCVFSAIDGQGRIRCHLHGFARARGVEQSSVQPFSCRLFPLIVVDLGAYTLLSVVSASTWRLVGSHPWRRYPCLTDPSLPPLLRSMRRDLDWAFGDGFARALARLAREE
jgi:hypothetical protein